MIEGPPYRAEADGRDPAVERFCARYTRHDVINGFPWVVIVDQSEFTAANLENFLWVTFTRQQSGHGYLRDRIVRGR